MTKPNPRERPRSSFITRTLSVLPGNMRTISPSGGAVTSSGPPQGPLTKSCEDLLELLVVVVFSKVFDVDVGELQGLAAQLLLSLFTGFKVSHKTAEERKKTQRCQQQRGTKRAYWNQIFCVCCQVTACVCVQVSVLHFSVIEQHPVHGFDGSIRCLFSLKVNKPVALGSSFVTNDLRKAGLCRLEPVSSHGHQQRPIKKPFSLKISFTLQDRMFPNAEKVSYRALLSIDSSMFLIKMFPTPDFLSPGSRWDHIIRMGRPLITS